MTEDEQNPREVIGGNNPPISEVLADTCKELLAEIDPLRDRANAIVPKIKDGIKDDETVAVVADIVIDARDLNGRLEARRKVEKQPHWDAGKAVDAFFADHSAPLDEIVAVLEDFTTAYQRKKAADARAAAQAEADKLRAEEEKLRAAAEAAKKPATAEKKHDQADEAAAKADAAEAKAATSNHDLAKLKTATGVTAGAKTIWKFSITDYEKIPLDKLRPYIARKEIEAAITKYMNIQKGASSLEGVHFEEDVKATFRR